jgi:hypothetical protein
MAGVRNKFVLGGEAQPGDVTSSILAFGSRIVLIAGIAGGAITFLGSGYKLTDGELIAAAVCIVGGILGLAIASRRLPGGRRAG